MNRALLNVYGFLGGLCLAVALCFPFVTHAAVTVQPLVAGYTPSAAKLSGWGVTSGQYLAAESAYGVNGSINILGKSATITGKLPLAADAAALATAGMRLNPLVLAGTLALPWLLDQGLEYSEPEGGWVKQAPETADNANGTWSGHYLTQPFVGPLREAVDTLVIPAIRTGNGCAAGVVSSWCPAPSTIACAPVNPTQYSCSGYAGGGLSYTSSTLPSYARNPATQSDWDNLPSPLATVGPELPTAPYMNGGAPVSPPTWAPQTVNTGAPYKMPDGSTVQPKATVTDAGGGNVTVVTYNTTIYNSAGQPVTDAPPVETPEEDKQDLCEAHPEILACQELGTVDPYALEKTTHTMVFTPEASPISGSCPSPISLPNGGALSFSSACDAMTQIRPVVLALAGILTGIMVVGSLRNGG